jgi:hypothetical protein
MARSELDVTCSAQVLSYITHRGEGAQDERSRRAWIKDKVETEALNATEYSFKYYYSSRLFAPLSCNPLTCHDITRHHLLQSDTYTNHNTMHVVHASASIPCVSYIQDTTVTINSLTVPGCYGAPDRDMEYTHMIHRQYCQMYAHVRRVPVNCNITPSFRWLFHHRHTSLMGVLGIMLRPL